ncbi:hypothetical protein Y032_0700g1641 [Ancylostoma ceylanicum]|uniref:Uncharacterized protein n=1 Tax=Ancylostoma ceylanicum TaxID=53326 RepID=A0A016WFW6_9BILA|nr:hypothetical protein Y032_0700g1641 [Ancylostoma ceylanicum]
MYESSIKFKYQCLYKPNTVLGTVTRVVPSSACSALCICRESHLEPWNSATMNNPNTDIICDPVAYEMFRTDLQRRFNDNDHHPRCASPLDEAATKIQAAFRGHVVGFV